MYGWTVANQSHINLSHVTMPRHSRSSSRSSRESRSRSRSEISEVEGVRVHVGELPVGCSERDLEHTFKKFGPLVEVWMAKIPPCFAFIVFRDKEDAEEAVRAMNNRSICGKRVRVSLARPRVEVRGPRRASYSGDARCYQCGERGHLSRNCYASRSRRSYSPKRRRPSSSSASSRSRSRSRDKRSKKRTKSPNKESSEDRSNEKRSSHKSSKQSSSKRHKEKEEDEAGSSKEKRRTISVRSEDQEPQKASTSAEKVSTKDDKDSS